MMAKSRVIFLVPHRMGRTPCMIFLDASFFWGGSLYGAVAEVMTFPTGWVWFVLREEMESNSPEELHAPCGCRSASRGAA